MDLDPTLMRDVRKIAVALHRFGRGHRWHYSPLGFPIDEEPWYHINVTVNKDWYRFFTTFVVDDNTWSQSDRLLDEVHSHLLRELSGEPDLLNAINIQLKSSSQYLNEGPIPLGPSDVYVSDEKMDDFYHLARPRKKP
jgi:hypothetical protein